jgi:hypothetical protein
MFGDVSKYDCALAALKTSRNSVLPAQLITPSPITCAALIDLTSNMGLQEGRGHPQLLGDGGNELGRLLESNAGEVPPD